MIAFDHYRRVGKGVRTQRILVFSTQQSMISLPVHLSLLLVLCLQMEVVSYQPDCDILDPCSFRSFSQKRVRLGTYFDGCATWNKIHIPFYYLSDVPGSFAGAADICILVLSSLFLRLHTILWHVYSRFRGLVSPRSRDSRLFSAIPSYLLLLLKSRLLSCWVRGRDACLPTVWAFRTLPQSLTSIQA